MANLYEPKNDVFIVHRVPVKCAYLIEEGGGCIGSYSEEIANDPIARKIHGTLISAVRKVAGTLNYNEVDDYSVIKYCFNIWLYRDDAINHECKDFYMDLKYGTFYSPDRNFAERMISSVKSIIDEDAIIDIDMRVALHNKLDCLVYRNEYRVSDKPIGLLKTN
jgi:hypothetical protein